jgi:biotin carboxylase
MSDGTTTLLVLGASPYQLPVIRRAKARGLRVVTTDNIPGNPGHRVADVAYGVDTTDGRGVLGIAVAEQVGGVIAACTDVAVPTAALVASELGLPGPPVVAAEVLCDKLRFRRWLEGVGLPTPRSVAVDPLDARWPGEGPWVLKPIRSSGSKGIFIVRSHQDLMARLPQALEFGGQALLEAFIPGEQLTCEGLLRDGAVASSWVTRRETAPEPYVATWGHQLPSRIGAEAEQVVVAAVHDVLSRLGVQEGPFDADVVWDGDRAHLLEVTPRLGGNSLSSLIEAASGLDLVDEAVCCACGLPFGERRPTPTRPAALLLLGALSRGRLQYDEVAFEALTRQSWVSTISMDKRIGEEVEPFINGRHRVGEALVVADTVEVLAQRCQDVRARLAVRAE